MYTARKATRKKLKTTRRLHSYVNGCNLTPLTKQEITVGKHILLVNMMKTEAFIAHIKRSFNRNLKLRSGIQGKIEAQDLELRFKSILANSKV